MNFQTVTLRVPNPVYQRVKRAAEALQRPLEEMIVNTLRVAVPLLDDVSPTMAAELAALSSLPDEALWQVAKSVMSAKSQNRFSTLAAIQRERRLTFAEEKKINALREEYGRVTLRKAQAYALLHQRGLYSATNTNF